MYYQKFYIFGVEKFGLAVRLACESLDSLKFFIERLVSHFSTRTRAVDPHSFFADPDPAEFWKWYRIQLLSKYGSGSRIRILNADPCWSGFTALTRTFWQQLQLLKTKRILARSSSRFKQAQAGSSAGGFQRHITFSLYKDICSPNQIQSCGSGSSKIRKSR